MKKLRWWHWVIFVVIIIFGINRCIDAMIPKELKEQIKKNEDKKIKEDSTKVARKDELINALVFAQLYLGKNLKDPDSYQEIESDKYYVSDSKTVYIQVIIKYRAKNGFGGMNIEKKGFDFDKNLNIIEVFDPK